MNVFTGHKSALRNSKVLLMCLSSFACFSMFHVAWQVFQAVSLALTKFSLIFLLGWLSHEPVRQEGNFYSSYRSDNQMTLSKNGSIQNLSPIRACLQCQLRFVQKSRSEQKISKFRIFRLEKLRNTHELNFSFSLALYSLGNQ